MEQKEQKGKKAKDQTVDKLKCISEIVAELIKQYDKN